MHGPHSTTSQYWLGVSVVKCDSSRCITEATPRRLPKELDIKGLVCENCCILMARSIIFFRKKRIHKEVAVVIVVVVLVEVVTVVNPPPPCPRYGSVRKKSGSNWGGVLDKGVP